MASSIHALATAERAADRPALREAPGLGPRLLADPSGRIGLAIVAGLCVIAIVGPLLISYDPSVVDVPRRLQPPSGEHWLGTDEFGRDILGGLVSGAHITLQIGLISVAIGILVGSPFGLLAGYFRGSVDLIVSAVTDILLAFPSFLLALAIVSALGPSLQNAMIAVGVRTIPIFVRLARSSTLATRELEFVAAARSLGAGHSRQIVRHILPHTLSPLVVLATFEFPASILVAASLSFLGLGAQPPTSDWGRMLVGARSFLRTAPWVIDFPGLAIIITVLGFNLLGNALRDALDPRLRN